MKKVLAFVLVAALVLSIGVTAFADNSPVVRDYTRVTADGSAPAPAPAPASTDESGLEVCNVKDEVIDVVPDSKVVRLSVGQEDLLSDADRAVFMDALAAARAVTDKLVQSIFWLNVKDYEEPADFAYYRLIFSCTGENVQVSVNGKDMEVVHIEDTNYYAKLTELGAVTISCDK